MSATMPPTPRSPDLDEVVEQIDFLTSDVDRMGRMLRDIRAATIITAVASAFTILGFLLSIAFVVVGVTLGW